MTEKKIFELAIRLLEQTKRGARHWEATVSSSVSEPAQPFLTSFPKYSVKISQAWDGSGDSSHVVLRIYNEEGSEIEAASDDELDKMLGHADRVHELFRELYQEARRSALNVEGALDDLLASLS